MSIQEWSCLEHGQTITNFCIHKHNCPNRRLCYKCLETNHNNIDQIYVPLVEVFQKSLSEKLIGFDYGQPFKLLIMIQQFQDQINKIFQSIQSAAQLLLDSNMDNNIAEIKQKLQTDSFLSFSESDTNLMIRILRDNLLEDKYNEQHSFRNRIQGIELLLSSFATQSIKKLSEFITTNNKENVDDNISIQGQKVMGLNQGDYYYCYDNGTKEFAGTYKFGIKQGEWKEYCEQKYKPYRIPGHELLIQKKQIIYKIVNYKDGVEVKNNYPQEKQIYRIGLSQLLNESQAVGEELFDCREIEFRGQLQNELKIGRWQYIIDGKIIGGGEFDKSGQKISQWIECDQLNNRFLVFYQGEYRNGLRFGQWTTSYKNNKIGGGNYDENEIKSGNWTDLHENFQSECQVFYTGEYKDGVRFGQWFTFYKRDKIGGGNYDEKGIKSGFWTDLHENFSDWNQVVYQGEYRNGVKFGLWTTFYKDNKIGGGNYNDKGVKSGNWIDLHSNYQDQCQVVYKGEYENGFRLGLWTTLYYNNKIGEGKYDDNGFKIGKWIDLDESFWKYLNSHCSCGQVAHSGEYRNGLRFGEWSVLSRNDKIGGGNYDEKGMKSGRWTDSHENFWDYCEITYSGEYLNGLRFGYWNTFYQQNKIGGGAYDDKGVKIGDWTDLHQNFRNNCHVVYSGEYRNGLRVGQWTTVYKNKYMYGGKYDDKGVKIGKWIDLHQDFWNCCPVVYQGKYINGLRRGQWTTFYKKSKIGGGNFDDNGVKSGEWIDLHENFGDGCQVIHLGEYRKGLRFGNWKIEYENNEIGGGNYDEKGEKSGNWIDPHDDYRGCEVVYTGEFRNGLRFGYWAALYKNNKIGGGNYDENGIKIGNWTDLHENFNYCCQVVYSGLYNNGLRIGQWTTFYRKNKICDGNYDYKEDKSGNWTDLHQNFGDLYQVAYQGEYRNGLRFGLWSTLYKNNNIGGGNYNDNGRKSGKWTEIYEYFSDDCQIICLGEYQNGLRLGQWNDYYLNTSQILNTENYDENGIIISKS